MVEYLETYARHHELDVRIGVEAFRIDRPGDLWEVATSAGTFSASHVVVATGYNRRPRTPDWPGASGFTGGLIHAADYRNFNDFGSREVLVIGSGNTGAEISQDLSEHGAGKVWISIRTPPHIVPRNIGPLPITAVTIVIRRLPSWMTDPMVRLTQRLLIGDLEPYGLARPRIGAFARHRQEPDYIPLLDIGFVRALRSGAVEVVAAVERMEGPRVHLADGTVLEPDAVITAIGYERGLEPLVGHLGVLAVNGAPLPQPNQPPGLHFVGYLNDFNGAIWAHSWEARRVSRSIRRTLDNRQELSQLA
jgi:cation diffusion facilitator CzcD-associated flavoprotein CzcO